MKYDVVKYNNGYSQWAKIIYAITENNDQIGLSLPEECESVEMGREWIVWIEKDYRRIFIEPAKEFDMTQITPHCVTTTFSLFLAQRKSAEEKPYIPAKGHEDMSKEYQEQQPEDSAEGEYETFTVTKLFSHVPSREWYIRHKPSKAMVSMPFDSREIAESFLQWWLKRWSQKPHTAYLDGLEGEFKDYKAETAEPEVEYRCPCCFDGGDVVILQYEGSGDFYIKCNECLSRSDGFHERYEQPNKLWIAGKSE